jgi:hypothetical protein
MTICKNADLRQSYSISYILNHQNLSSIPENYNSTHSLPIKFEEKPSFAQFIAEEKQNLRFFPSFRQKNKIISNEKNKKKLMRNFYFLPSKIPNNYHLAMNNSKIFNNEKPTTTCVTHSSNFSLSTSSNNTKSMTENLKHKPIGIINMNQKRRIHCVERHINYMNDDQTKAAVCFILQLNTYINQRILSLQKKYNEYCVQSKKVWQFLISKKYVLDKSQFSILIYEIFSRIAARYNVIV